MTKENPEQRCFVISPIGQAESDIRRNADKVLNRVIKWSLEPLGFEVVRADAISEPGTINLQVLKRIVDSEIVVADLTGTNPNVMYELAIRHAIRKPVRERFLSLCRHLFVHGFHGKHGKERWLTDSSVKLSVIREVRVLKKSLRNSLLFS